MNKALTRQPVSPGIGVPIVPFMVVESALISLSANISWFFLIVAFAAWYIMKLMTQEDEAIFHLMRLKMRTLRIYVNRFYGTTVFSASQYDAVDIKEIANCMKLNQRLPLENLIPYSLHIDTHIVKTRENNDELATWEVIGVPFECEEDNDLAIINSQLNTMIRAWERKPVTFYTHRIRETFYDHLDTPSGNPFADEISKNTMKE